MKFKSIKYFFEYLAFISFVSLIRFLPYSLALNVGACLSFIAFILMRKTRRMVSERLAMVMGNNATDYELKRSTKDAFYYLVLNGIDLIRLDKFSDKQLRQIVEIFPTLEQIKETKMFENGGILATPHMGSWELGAVFFHKNIAPLTVITAKQHNPYIDKFFRKQREKIGIKSIERNAGMALSVLSKLQKKQIVAILPDLRFSEAAIEVKFLNGIANINPGTAFLAKISNVPIFPCIITRKSRTLHKVVVHPPIFPNKNLDKTEDVKKMTHCFMGIFDKAIKENLPQWFWFNRRWILEPVPEPSGEKKEEKT